MAWSQAPHQGSVQAEAQQLLPEALSTGQRPFAAGCSEAGWGDRLPTLSLFLHFRCSLSPAVPASCGFTCLGSTALVSALSQAEQLPGDRT